MFILLWIPLPPPGVTVGFSQTQYRIQEGNTVLVCVEITSGILETDVFVFLSSIDGDAIGNNPYILY